MSTLLLTSRFGWWREDGAGVDREPVAEVLPVVWSSCSKWISSEGARDDGGRAVVLPSGVLGAVAERPSIANKPPLRVAEMS